MVEIEGFFSHPRYKSHSCVNKANF
jgi:hypothetical protein